MGKSYDEWMLYSCLDGCHRIRFGKRDFHWKNEKRSSQTCTNWKWSCSLSSRYYLCRIPLWLQFLDHPRKIEIPGAILLAQNWRKSQSISARRPSPSPSWKAIWVFDRWLHYLWIPWGRLYKVGRAKEGRSSESRQDPMENLLNPLFAHQRRCPFASSLEIRLQVSRRTVPYHFGQGPRYSIAISDQPKAQLRRVIEAPLLNCINILN